MKFNEYNLRRGMELMMFRDRLPEELRDDYDKLTAAHLELKAKETIERPVDQVRLDFIRMNMFTLLCGIFSGHIQPQNNEAVQVLISVATNIERLMGNEPLEEDQIRLVAQRRDSFYNEALPDLTKEIKVVTGAWVGLKDVLQNAAMIEVTGKSEEEIARELRDVVKEKLNITISTEEAAEKIKESLDELKGREEEGCDCPACQLKRLFGKGGKE